MCQENDDAFLSVDKQVWYTGQRAEKIPAGLIGIVGSKCTSLDLSYNELASISAVRDFVNLEELILDNNKLRDCSTLPHMPNLLTLSLNNNKVYLFRKTNNPFESLNLSTVN